MKLNVGILKSDIEMRQRYNIAVQNRYSAVTLSNTIDSQWNMLKDSLQQTSKEIIPVVTKKIHKEWMTDDILQIMDRRRQKREHTDEYNKLSKEIKANCNEAKEEWLNKMFKAIDVYRNNSRSMHKGVMEIVGKKLANKNGCLKSKTGEILMEKCEIINRWTEYIGDLYNDNRQDFHMSHNEEGPSILREEVAMLLNIRIPGKLQAQITS
jgi:hypothetical protein